ncbi:MAG: hypothetical protein COB41_02495 [Proteobacteria bacterium]|nr:MAG: hypothetical protein COB41_02495 [Pseudomonadota bacterium]
MDQEDKKEKDLLADEKAHAGKNITKQGMSDEEIIASGVGLESRDRVPKWFWAIIAVVVLVAYGLTVPFWGDRVDSPRPWFTWGHVGALAYILVFGGFVYFMTMMYGDDGGEAEDQEEFDGLSGHDKSSGEDGDKK